MPQPERLGEVRRRSDGTITRDSLMSLEAYAKIRKAQAPEFIAHRKLRSVGLGEHITVQFEDEQTIRRQIQEMLHIEKIFEEEGIQARSPPTRRWCQTAATGRRLC
jgi:hypothetical protein